MLKMYKKQMALLLYVTLRNREREPILMFEDPEMGSYYYSLRDTCGHVDTTTVVKDVFATLDGFERDVLKDLTFYIDDAVNTCISCQVINVIVVTFNRFYELEFISKQLKMGRL